MPLFINRNNQAPIADAGPDRFGTVGQWIEVDGGLSSDPDEIGFSRFQWRKISGPGNMEIRTISQEPNNDDGSQRQPNGVPNIDNDGNLIADPLSEINALPQLRFNAPGDYVVGLTVTDREGLPSAEATTTVHVAARYDRLWKVNVHVGKRGDQLVFSAAASDAPFGTRFRFMADSRTPLPLTVSADGLEATTPLPSEGTYFVHVQAGDLSGTTSYPAQAVARVAAQNST